MDKTSKEDTTSLEETYSLEGADHTVIDHTFYPGQAVVVLNLLNRKRKKILHPFLKSNSNYRSVKYLLLDN